VSGVWFQRSPEALTRSFGPQRDVLLASTDRDELDQLSGTSAAVWDLLRVPRTMEELIDALSEIYRTGPEAIGRDVEVLLEELVARGWVEAISDGDD
jgi:hypothetical protein